MWKYIHIYIYILPVQAIQGIKLACTWQNVNEMLSVYFWKIILKYGSAGTNREKEKKIGFSICFAVRHVALRINITVCTQSEHVGINFRCIFLWTCSICFPKTQKNAALSCHHRGVVGRPLLEATVWWWFCTHTFPYVHSYLCSPSVGG